MIIPAELGFSAEFEEAKKKLDALNKEYAAMLTEYDELTGTVRANLETEYMMKIGRKEHQLFSLQIQVQQLKREIALYQAAKNQGKAIAPETVQKIIEEEFAEYKKQLEEQQEKIRFAEKLHFGPKLSAEESKAKKDLYHDLVKKLHPDLNPDLPQEAKTLWLKIQAAYQSWDWQELDVLADMVYALLEHKEIKIKELTGLDAILEQQKKILERMELLRTKTEEMCSRPPFTYKELLLNRDAINAKRRELDDLKVEFEEHIHFLEDMLNELKGQK